MLILELDLDLDFPSRLECERLVPFDVKECLNFHSILNEYISHDQKKRSSYLIKQNRETWANVELFLRDKGCV